MDHDEFVRLWDQDAINPRLETGSMTHIAASGGFSPIYTWLENFGSWATLLALAGGIATIFLVNWYTGLIVIGFSFWLATASQKWALRGAFKALREDEEFFNNVSASGMLLLQSEDGYITVEQFEEMARLDDT
jgi:hypothetical protein